ncbi:hypothetical protein D3C87_896450 [compost metagenome]
MQASHLSFHKDLDSDDFSFIHKAGPEWGSEYRTTPNAIEGSPTLFIKAYGMETARYFGFEFENDNVLRVPRVAYFNRQLKKLNEVLPTHEVCKLKFYEASGEPQTARDHLERFLKDCSLPIANEGSVAIHDTSYHLGGIFFPEACLVTGLAQAELILGFANHLEKKNFPQEEIDKILFEMSLNVDSSTGNFSHFVTQSEPPKKSAYWILSREGFPAKKYLAWVVPLLLKEKYFDLNVERELTEYLDTVPALYEMLMGPTPAEYDKLVREKIERIQKAVQKLCS